MVEYTLQDFDIKKLGNFYYPDKTVFRVFAPEYEELFLFLNDHKYEMHRNHYYFEIALAGDLELERYCYITSEGKRFKDPFSYVSIDGYSVIVNKDKFIDEVIRVKENKNVVIYEANVRDFSSHISYPGKYRSKFLSFTEEGLTIGDNQKVGLDYLKDIGITHLQIMPIFDYDNDKNDYNWGYNPIGYNYVKKDYVYDQDNPYAYVNELRTMVNCLHKNNIKVVLDVVFNHVYDWANNDLQIMLPGHVFRLKKDGTLAEGTFCGNEVKSEDVFIREYICEMVMRYLKLFDIDGIRMDLMGISDIKTVNKIKSEVEVYKKDFLVYGEGWHMGDALPEVDRASIPNCSKLPGVAMFNDHFRDVVIKYVSGDDSLSAEMIKALAGNHDYLDASQSINYVECHDGYTMYDHMYRYLGDNIKINRDRCKLAMSIVLIARGIPFIHMGEEFYRSKKGVKNSYCSDDLINGIDWTLTVKNNNDCEYFKQLVEIRNSNSCFYEKKAKISFENYRGAMIYYIDDLMIIINPTDTDLIYYNGDKYHTIFDKNGKCAYDTSILNVYAYSLVICKV